MQNILAYNTTAGASQTYGIIHAASAGHSLRTFATQAAPTESAPDWTRHLRAEQRLRPHTQIDGTHIEEDLMLLAVIGIDAEGRKHPLGVFLSPFERGTQSVGAFRDIRSEVVDISNIRRFSL